MSKVREGILVESISTPAAITWARALAVLGFACALAVSAHVRIPLPFTPVPLTLQTLFALLAGAMLGPQLAAVSVGLYLGAGAAGLPVTASGVFLGPTIGYLVGFLAASVAVGAVCRPQSPTYRVIGGLLLGTVIIYVCGAGWLAMLEGHLGWDTLAKYVLPFLPGDLLKLAVAAAALRCVRPLSRTLRPV